MMGIHGFDSVLKCEVTYRMAFVFDTNYSDTTGLQSSTAVMELDGSITVTCTFATGASSTGCQITIFMMDSVQKLFSRNITRAATDSEVH